MSDDCEAFWCVLCISWFSNNQCNPCFLWTSTKIFVFFRAIRGSLCILFQLCEAAIAPRSGMNNRRVAGAVDFPAFRIHYVQTKNSTGDCRPGGEAFWCVCVFCGSQIISVIRVFCGF